jgi:hypothetical protein
MSGRGRWGKVHSCDVRKTDLLERISLLPATPVRVLRATKLRFKRVTKFFLDWALAWLFVIVVRLFERACARITDFDGEGKEW